jgi:hypothetical protein
VSGLPPTTLFLMGRLAEHYAQVAGETRRTLVRSWRKVRGKRWKSLRTRLGELRERAEVAQQVLPTGEPTATPDAISAGDGFAERPPETEPRTLKH